MFSGFVVNVKWVCCYCCYCTVCKLLLSKTFAQDAGRRGTKVT